MCSAGELDGKGIQGRRHGLNSAQSLYKKAQAIHQQSIAGAHCAPGVFESALVANPGRRARRVQ